MWSPPYSTIFLYVCCYINALKVNFQQLWTNQWPSDITRSTNANKLGCKAKNRKWWSSSITVVQGYIQGYISLTYSMQDFCLTTCVFCETMSDLELFHLKMYSCRYEGFLYKVVCSILFLFPVVALPFSFYKRSIKGHGFVIALWYDIIRLHCNCYTSYPITDVVENTQNCLKYICVLLQTVKKLCLLPTSYWSCLPSCQCGEGTVGQHRQREPPRSLRWGWGKHKYDPHTGWSQRLYSKPLLASPGQYPGFTTQRYIN